MKEAWKVKKLGDVLSFEYGKPLNATRRDSKGLYPVYGANGAISRSNDFLVDGKSIIVGRKGSAGEINYTEDRFWPLDVTYYILFDKKEIDLDFIFYLLKKIDLKKLAKGVKPGINRNEVYAIECGIPSLDEQQQIVSILDRTFAAIDHAKANIERNLHNAEELFRSELNAVFSQTGEEWEIKTLNQISTNLDSRRVPITKSHRSAGKYPYYGASGIVDYVDSYIFDDDLLLISEDGANLLARTYPIAFTASGKTWVNNHAHVLKFKEMHTHRFVEFYLNSIKLDKYVSGMAQPKLNQAMLNTIPIPLPPSQIQIRLVERLELLFKSVKHLEANYQSKLKNLEDLMNAILHKAFSGQLNVNEDLLV